MCTETKRTSRTDSNRLTVRPLRRLLLGLLVVGVLLAGGCTGARDPVVAERAARARALAAPWHFNLVSWEVDALVSELGERIIVRDVDFTGAEARMEVLSYLAIANEIGRLEGEVERIVASNPGREEEPSEAFLLEQEARALRVLRAERRPRVERILEQQVSHVMANEGLGWLGTRLPPPVFHFSQPPDYLVVSPRDEIRLEIGIYLMPGLSVAEREALEQAVEREVKNSSALVSGTGGFSSWPTMIVDRASLEWVLSTIAHEWTHVYLAAFPLGWSYYDSPDMTAVNETVADIVGDEIGHKTLRRFYPELIKPEKADAGPEREPAQEEAQGEEFDFVREMRLTRQTVDRLLAEGKVEEAERYMEQRRQFFVEHGHFIRRLNQAYFAFHGSYRTGPAAPAEDPIAPRLRRLREESPSLLAFLRAVRGMTSLDDLLRRVP